MLKFILKTCLRLTEQGMLPRRRIRGPMPSDLELGRLYVKDLRPRCSRLNLTTTGGRDALIKRIEEACTNIDNLPGTPPPIQDGGEHMKMKMIKMPSNCNFSTFSAKSRSYWTGSRHKTGFYQPPSSPKYNQLFKGH